MRRVVVLPQPDGPSKVVKLAPGTSSDTSSTAGAEAPAKRLFTCRSRTLAACSPPTTAEPGCTPRSAAERGSAIRDDRAELQSAAAQPPDHHQHARGHADHGDRERRGATPVEV